MSRAWLGALAVLAPLVASAQQHPWKAHMEACTEWKHPGARIGTRNECNRPVTIMFMDYGDRRVVENDVPPGGWFDSGVDGPSPGYMFTVCPVGYVPSVKFSLENQAAIIQSLYNCLPRDKPDV